MATTKERIKELVDKINENLKKNLDEDEVKELLTSINKDLNGFKKEVEDNHKELVESKVKEFKKKINDNFAEEEFGWGINKSLLKDIRDGLNGLKKKIAEKVEELERKMNSFPSREQQIEVLNGIEDIAQSLKERDKEWKKELGDGGSWMWEHKSYRFDLKTFESHEKRGEKGEYSNVFIRDVAFHLWNEEQKRSITEKDNPLESYLWNLIHSFSYMTGRVIHYDGQLKELKNSRVGELTERLNHEKIRVENAEQKIKELKEEVRKNLKKDEIIKELKEELNRANKPLPSLPKKSNKFKRLETKIKTKFQNLIKKTKQQSQELMARIEVKTK